MERTTDPMYIAVEAGVRYWEDATVNGEKDADGNLIPFRRGDLWCPVIRLHDGLVMDWTLGSVADVHYKVCDEGEYWLLNAEKQRIAKWAGFYVPDDFLCQGGSGYGDYIILRIDAEGFVRGWEPGSIEFVCEGDEDSQIGWNAIASIEHKNGGAS